jgi:hypothetical protein
MDVSKQQIDVRLHVSSGHDARNVNSAGCSTSNYDVESGSPTSRPSLISRVRDLFVVTSAAPTSHHNDAMSM